MLKPTSSTTEKSNHYVNEDSMLWNGSHIWIQSGQGKAGSMNTSSAQRFKEIEQISNVHIEFLSEFPKQGNLKRICPMSYSFLYNGTQYGHLATKCFHFSNSASGSSPISNVAWRFMPANLIWPWNHRERSLNSGEAWRGTKDILHQPNFYQNSTKAQRKVVSLWLSIKTV